MPMYDTSHSATRHAKPAFASGQSHLDLRMAPRTSWHALSGPPGPVRASEGTKPDTQIRCTGPGGPLKACHDDDDRLPNPKCDCPGPGASQRLRLRFQTVNLLILRL